MDRSCQFHGRERRARVRFPLALPVQYLTMAAEDQRTGGGQTINISSGGLLFASEHELSLGAPIEVVAQWPIRSETVLPLSLHLWGKIVRVSGFQAAVQTHKYEFQR